MLFGSSAWHIELYLARGVGALTASASWELSAKPKPSILLLWVEGNSQLIRTK